MINDKDTIRKEMLDTRCRMNNCEIIQKSMIIVSKLISMEYIRDSLVIMCYLNFKNEADIKEFIEYCLNNKKIVVLPVILKKDNKEPLMITSQINNINTDTQCQHYGIYQPNEHCKQIDPCKIDIVIVPGVAFDKNKNRLGFGKGYYDSFLKKVRSDTIKIGIGYDFQIIEHIPKQEHDVPMDIVVTENRIIN